MLSNRTDLRKIREIYSKALKSQKRKILVCCGTGCLAGGSMDIHHRLKELIEEKGLKCTVELEKDPHGDSIGLKRVAVMALWNGSSCQNWTRGNCIQSEIVWLRKK